MVASSADPKTLMTPELHQFAQQLAIWTELIIENGRTPFRRVDLYPEIHTARGILRPPLVFWINRQSMMAGGILLLPEQDLETELKHGCSCCAALGLQHFVTWENKQVRIWQCGSDGPQQHQQFNLEHADHPDQFRHLLGELLETLKLLAVVGLVPAAELSPCYLHNLFQITLDLALPPLVNSYRSQRATAELSMAADADQLACEANRLLLLQLLGLLWHQQLQSAILPEKFERSVQLTLPQLPEPLRAALSLSVTATPPVLPHETAVCFHHLQLRLRQLAWRQSEQRAIASIQQLIAGWYPGQRDPHPQADVLLYPQYPALGTATQLILSDSPALLAAIGLQQDLLQQPPQQLVLGNLFQLKLNGRTDLSINGVLINQRLLSTAERHQFATLLRTSWPNRRFRIGADKPLWFWELIHLLGLSKDQRELQLTLPRAALQSSPTEALWSLLQDYYSIQRVTPLADEQVSLQLIPVTGLETPTVVARADETRILPGTTELPRFRNQLLLALYLPAEIYRLLDDKLIWPDRELLDKQAGAGMQSYKQSSLWQLFEQILGPPFTTAENTTVEALESWPRPDNLHLREIGRAAGDEPHVDADRLLATLLQVPAIHCLDIPQNKRKPTTPARISDKKLQQDLVEQLLREGIPTFPEPYLYFLEQPDMATYRLTPPLTVNRELLGEIELEDAAGQTLLVYGEELSNALLLCSVLGKTEVDLPLDRQQLALLQQHYWQDMDQLHKQLSSRCHSLLQNSKDAAKLTRKVWKKLKLPKLP